MQTVYNFERKTPSNITWDEMALNCGKNIRIYTIESIHDLTQYIGFAKYINKGKYNVFLRGQPDLYDGKMIPSLYRGKKKLNTTTTKYGQRMNSLIKKCPVFSDYKRNIMEPMLQHYGVKTSYLDVVDNVWVALWFALHQAKTVCINSHEYVYYCDNEKPDSFIVLLASDAITPSAKQDGVYCGTCTSLVDLRKAVPSYFLRPHAQHAYMLRKNDECPGDYSDLIVGIARIPTNIGIKWLGNNEFLSVRSLFPAPYFDSGYAKLLHDYPDSDQSTIRQYGSIQIISD